MKRCFSVLVCILLLVLSCGYAETTGMPTVELSKYSTDELVELADQIADELFDRNGLVVLYDGEYVVGKDIAVGDYIITDHTDDVVHRLDICVYKSESAKAEYEKLQYSSEDYDWQDYYSYYSLYGKSDVKVTLADGEVLTTDGHGDCRVTIAKTTKLFMD